MTPAPEQIPPEVVQEASADGWECFRDSAYFDLWCVRQVGARAFGTGFHLNDEREANALAALLMTLDRQADLKWQAYDANAALRTALEFYADESAWNQPPVKTVAHEIFGKAYENQASKVRLDRGHVARAALASQEAQP